MKHSLLVAALLATALTACGKKDEAAAAPLPPPAVAPALPAATSAPAAEADTVKPADPAAQTPAPVTTASPEGK